MGFNSGLKGLTDLANVNFFFLTIDRQSFIVKGVM
jgi:hypothetical protein